MEPQKSTDYDQPVAYDKNGNPLYAHPPVEQPPQPVSIVPHAEHPVSEDDIKRHEEAVAKYPNLNLSKGEYVITQIPRHWIGVIVPPLVGGLLALMVCIILILYPLLVPSGNPPFSSIVLPALLLLVLIAIGVYIPVWVYRQNEMYLTNESVILYQQLSLFSRDQKLVSLGSVEDISFKQTGLPQLMLGYGTVRLSTVGKDVFTFTFAVEPKKHTQLINDTIEDFKNARKVSWS
jgi:hypothetical protein